MHAFILELGYYDTNNTSSKDEDWVHGPSNSKSNPSGNCIIHCTYASDNLVSLHAADSWEVLLKATTVRQHEALLKVASSLPEGAIPDKKDHWKCKSTFTMKKLLDNIKENEKINFP